MIPVQLRPRPSWLSAMAATFAVGLGSSTALAQADMDAVYEAAQEEGTVVWYVTYPLDEATPIATAFEERYPGISVELVRGSGTRIVERFETEYRADRATADVITGALLDPHIAWAKEGWLTEWQPPEGGNYPDEYKQDGFWYLEGITCSCMLYQPDRVSEDELPAEPTDLLGENWQGRLGTIPAWQTGTAAEFSFYIEQVLGEKEDFAPKLAAMEPRLASAQASLVEQVIRGEVDLAFPIADYNLYRFQKAGANVDCVYPQTAVPTNVRPVGIPSNAPHPNAAKLFMNWRLSEEGQTLMQDGFGMRSVRNGMPPPEGLPPLDELNVLIIDPAELRAVRDEMFARWQEVFGS